MLAERTLLAWQCEAEHLDVFIRCVVAVITFSGARGLPYQDNQLLGLAYCRIAKEAEWTQMQEHISYRLMMIQI